MNRDDNKLGKKYMMMCLSEFKFETLNNTQPIFYIIKLNMKTNRVHAPNQTSLFGHCKVKKSIGTSDFQFDASPIESKSGKLSTAESTKKRVVGNTLILNESLE